MNHKQFATIRADSTMTQKQLAEWIPADLRTVQRWESGECPVPGPVAHLMRLLWEKNQKVQAKSA